MAWANCENCNGSGKIYDYGTDRNNDCWSCGGSGRIAVGNSIHSNSGRDSTSQGYSGSRTPLSPPVNTYSMKYVIGILAFIGVGFYFLTITEQNLVIGAITGAIAGYICFRWHKAVIVLLVLGFLMYLISE